MKFMFPVVVRTNTVEGSKYSEVVLGNVKLLIKGGVSLIAIKNDDRAYQHLLPHPPLVGVEAMWIGKGQIVHSVTYQELLFHLNQMLWEQAKDILEPIMDDAFVRKD